MSVRVSLVLKRYFKAVCVYREKVRDIEELRRAVKHEAGNLEKQLQELAHNYDDSLKMVTLFFPVKSLLYIYFNHTRLWVCGLSVLCTKHGFEQGKQM